MISAEGGGAINAGASVALYAGCAAICLLLALLIPLMGRGRGALPATGAAAMTGAWAASVAAAPAMPLSGLSGSLEVLRSALWFVVLLGLAWRFAGPRGRPLARRFAAAGALVTAIALAASMPVAQGILDAPSFGSLAIIARISLSLLVVLLAENLYRNTSEAARWHVNLPCIVLGGLAAFDLLLFAEAAMSRSFTPAILDARAVLTGLSMPLLLVAAVRDRRIRRDPPVSREVVFHGATLLLAGGFLLLVGAAAELLRHIDPAWSTAAQASILAAAVMAIGVAATTGSARSRLRRLVVDHFFTARYDYRREWLRCVATLAGRADEAPATLRAIRAIADAVDSPGGALFLREADGGRLACVATWNGPDCAMALAEDHALVDALKDGAWIAEFAGDGAPQDLSLAFGRIWLAVPLPLHGADRGLFGVVLLWPPRAPFATDREVFDLLRTLGREVAMFLAERRAAETLAEQRRLEDYAKRFAFVAHDVKTVASQLRLLLANAEENIADPEFQRDMLVTVRASAGRIDSLIARLRQPEAPVQAREAPEPCAPGARLRALVAARPRPVRLDEDAGALGTIAMDPERFDTAIMHLLNNAEEASEGAEPVRIRVRQQGNRVVIDITDRGQGMTPEFIRDELFRPFGTAKPDGTGIGAWQARDLLRAAGGDLVVLSHLGAGTTMRVTLPILSGTSQRLQEDRA
ncbi:XrtA/PEP-CTERM system histidine kinase PrsK [Roseomonas rosulenta]|uniref:XrtA/PEP-CTERM system histidine kinase PrsK n=1 Tax=Roseomonas rosulenta TaxID=2748667 RepID=UPI0034E2CC1E